MHNVFAYDEIDQICVGPTRAEERRTRLAAAARILFCERGFHATGMAQIAEASGVKVGQIYRDFASKDDIIAAIVEADVTEFLDEAALRAAVAAGDRMGVRNWIVRFVVQDRIAGRDQLMPEIIAEAVRNERIAAIMAELDARIRYTMQAALTVFAPEPGRADDVAVVADLILTLVIGQCSRMASAVDRDVTALQARILRLVDEEIRALAGCG
ncbi:hypothetical protein ASE75_05460 [Sphingomonas sp. Leaf17]|uniref:TetR/AcrR family transcriptional regulator n=1 Tax=Sphingomonas sp. Leaf17 TaxID=1735683 RepID=UPI0006FEA1D7|nr:TetR/AcrR family transcriptional regulator [Sphingomonas sp. Leaf17]KQM65688.1 hypothetical protein ASE75_05460 [Sphingomonas sp. Leaf17]